MSGRDRNVNQVTVSGDYTVPIDMDYVFCDSLAADITVTLRRTKDRLIRWHKVEKSDSSAFTVTVTDGTLSYVLSAQGQAATFEIDANGNFHVFAANALSTGGGLAIPAGASVTYSSTSYAGTGSFQPIGPDLNLDAAAGSSTDPKYIATGMFNIFGDALTKTKTYIGSLIAKISITGTNPSSYPRGAFIAEVGDGVTAADGAVGAVLGGDSALTGADAAFFVDNQNTTPGSGFDYVLKGSKLTHDGYPALVPRKAFMLIGYNSGDLPMILAFGVATSDATIVTQVGADNTVADGSLYISMLDNAGTLWQKRNDVWVSI